MGLYSLSYFLPASVFSSSEFVLIATWSSGNISPLLTVFLTPTQFLYLILLLLPSSPSYFFFICFISTLFFEIANTQTLTFPWCTLPQHAIPPVALPISLIFLLPVFPMYDQQVSPGPRASCKGYHPLILLLYSFSWGPPSFSIFHFYMVPSSLYSWSPPRNVPCLFFLFFYALSSPSFYSRVPLPPVSPLLFFFYTLSHKLLPQKGATPLLVGNTALTPLCLPSLNRYPVLCHMIHHCL